MAFGFDANLDVNTRLYINCSARVSKGSTRPRSIIVKRWLSRRHELAKGWIQPILPLMHVAPHPIAAANGFSNKKDKGELDRMLPPNGSSRTISDSRSLEWNVFFLLDRKRDQIMLLHDIEPKNSIDGH